MAGYYENFSIVFPVGTVEEETDRVVDGQPLKMTRVSQVERVVLCLPPSAVTVHHCNGHSRVQLHPAASDAPVLLQAEVNFRWESDNDPMKELVLQTGETLVYTPEVIHSFLHLAERRQEENVTYVYHIVAGDKLWRASGLFNGSLRSLVIIAETLKDWLIKKEKAIFRLSRDCR